MLIQYKTTHPIQSIYAIQVFIFTSYDREKYGYIGTITSVILQR